MPNIKKNLFFNMIKTIMGFIFPLITFPYVSRILGVENIGKVQYAQSAVSYFSMIATLGFATYAIRTGSRIRDDRKQLSKFFQEILILNLCTTFLAYLALGVFLALNFFNGYTILMIICSSTILFATLAVDWMNSIKEDFAYVSMRSVLFQFLAIIFMFIFVKTKDDYFEYAALCVFSSQGYFFLNLIHVRKYVDFRIREKLEFKKHIKPVLIIFGMSVSVTIYNSLDVLVVRFFHGNYEVGLYATAIKLCAIVKQVANAFSAVVLSRLANYANDIEKKNEYTGLLKNSLNINNVLIIPCAIGMVMLASNLILFFTGPAFSESTVASQILSINVIFATINGILCYNILLPHDCEKQASLASFGGALANLILNLMLIPSFGINGAAVATLISEAIVFLFLSYYSSNFVDMKELFSDTPKFLIASIPIIITCFVFASLITSPLISIICSIIVSATIYFIILYKIKFTLVIDALTDIKKIFNK